MRLHKLDFRMEVALQVIAELSGFAVIGVRVGVISAVVTVFGVHFYAKSPGPHPCIVVATRCDPHVLCCVGVFFLGRAP